MNETMTAKDFPTIPEGTVISSGTLRPVDLLGALIEVACSTEIDLQFAHEACDVRVDLLQLEAGHTFGDEQDLALYDAASELIHDLCDALEDFIPAGCYVGMHEGDGSLLGVWRAEDED
jgi:hypothetical protein